MQIKVIKHRIKRFFRNIKFRLQKSSKGYSDSDVEYMNEWFVETMFCMLSELRQGMDTSLRDENIVANIAEMEECLCLMTNEGAIASVSEKAYSYEVVRKVMDENKDRFFKLLSDNFWELWI